MKKIKKGATLLEVVIALAIIAIMIIPLMSSLLTSVNANKMGEEVQDAKLISQQVIESLRLESNIKPGILNVAGMDLSLGAIQDDGTGKKYFPVTSTEMDGFTIEGKIIEEKTKQINNNNGANSYKDKKIGALLVVTADEVYYSNNTYKDKSIQEIIDQEKAIIGTNTGFEKVPRSGDQIEILFTNGAMGSAGNKFNIAINTSIKVNDTAFGVGIYVTEKNNFKFKFANQSNKTQDIYVFRNSSVSKEEGTLEGKIQETGLFNKFTNIIFDAENKSTGLYTAKLDVKRKEKVLEKTESQFYLKK